ncbi:MAG: hypothetical protein ACM3PP_14065 [Candidatus Saccharibacteria bacterium]
MVGGDFIQQTGNEKWNMRYYGIVTDPEAVFQPVLYCAVNVDGKDECEEKSEEHSIKIQIEGDPNRKLSQSEIDDLIRRLLELGCGTHTN